MSLDRAREYRSEARKCFDQAERAPTEVVRARMKEIAEAWLKMAADAEKNPKGTIDKPAAAPRTRVA